MKRLFILVGLISLTAVAADPQAARRAREERARQIAGEQGEATPAYASYVPGMHPAPSRDQWPVIYPMTYDESEEEQSTSPRPRRASQ